MKLPNLQLAETSLANLRWLAIVLLCTCAATGGWYYWASTARLLAAHDNLQTCRQLITSIQTAKHTPRRATLETRSLDDLGTAIESAAESAQLARDRVLRIDPQAAKRLGKTDYTEQATEVELSAVTLRQIVSFVYEIAGQDDQLQINTLRLRMPHVQTESTAEELWLADVVLTQRIYAPTAARRQ